MKKKYVRPTLHVIGPVGPMPPKDMAALSDEALEAYLLENGFLEKAKRYRRNDGYVYREIAGEGVLVPTGDLPGNVMLTLNETGAFLWDALQAPRTAGDLIFRAKSVYDDPQGMLEAQVHAFIEEKVQTGHVWEVKEYGEENLGQA